MESMNHMKFFVYRLNYSFFQTARDEAFNKKLTLSLAVHIVEKLVEIPSFDLKRFGIYFGLQSQDGSDEVKYHALESKKYLRL